MTISTWTAGYARSWRPTNSPVYGSGGWRTENQAYQGQWESYGLHRGLWFFDDAAIRSTLAGRTIVAVRVRLTRSAANHGVYAAQTPTIRLHGYSDQPSGQPTMGAGYSSHGQQWALGDTLWAQLPVSWGTALRDGTERGLGVYTTSDDPYMIFEAGAVLEIEHDPSTTAPTVAPTGLTQTDAGESYVSFGCDPVDGAETYDFERDGGSVASRSNPVYTETGLPAGFEDQWRVRAVNSGGAGPWSAWVSGWTLPATPTNLRQTGATHSSIIMEADPSTGASDYQFQPESAAPNVATRTDPYYEHGNRDPGESDRYRVLARTPAGPSPWSGWVTGTARRVPDMPTLEPVTSINRLQANRFRWTPSHPDGLSMSGYNIEFREVTAALPWIVHTAETTADYYDLAANELWAADWEWRVRTVDELGGWGPYSAWDTFEAVEPPSGPTITSPQAGVPVTAETWTVGWSASEQDRWQGQVLDGTTVLYDTGTVESATARSAEFPYPDNNTTRTTRVRVERDGLWSVWTSVTHPVSYTPPEAPFVILDTAQVAGAIRVAATHPNPQGDTPYVTSMDIWRRLAVAGPSGLEQIRVAADLLPSRAFNDWAVASAVSYDYAIQVWGENGVSSWSPWTSHADTGTWTLSTVVVGVGSVSGGGVYNDGATAVVTAYPAAGWLFDGWSGAASGTANPTSVSMDGDKSVTATFVEDTTTKTLTVSVSGSGSVTGGGTYTTGTTATVEAIPAAGWSFAGWSGDLTGVENPATIVMDTDKLVSATFVEEGTVPAATAAWTEQGDTVAAAGQRTVPAGTSAVMWTEQGDTVAAAGTYTVQQGFELVYETSGTGTAVAVWETPTVGNLLVVVQTHRHDLADPNPPGTGWTRRVLDQYQTSTSDRRGVVVWDKVSDGTETSVNLAWGTATDLGGVYMEFAAPPDGWSAYGTDATNSATSIVSSLTVPVPTPPSTTSLAIAAVVCRNETTIGFDSGFTDAASTPSGQVDMGWRKDAVNVPGGNVTATFTSGDQSSIVAAVYNAGTEFTAGSNLVTETVVQGTFEFTAGSENVEAQ